MKILFAVDGSQCSKAAIATALTMRCPAGTELMVVSAVDFFEPLPSLEGIKKREIDETEKLVQTVVEQLRETHPHAVVTGAVRDGYAYEEILDTCKEWKPDLLMLGSHGRTGINFLMTGSVSRAMLQEAPCAVRVIRARLEEHTQSDIHNVIVALDDSENSQTMIDHVLEFPWSEYTTFKCVNIVQEIHRGLLTEAEITPAEVLSEHYNDMVAGNKAWLEVASQKLNNKFGKRVAKAEVLLGEPRQALLELAKTWPADLIVMGSHGRRGFEKAIIGSVSEAVAMHASCSVEIIRIKSLAKKKVHFIV
ncbi:MAG: universal stress protein [Candidatus Melainabacteria bacterium]|nr:universal stress protein [Candidatus Melainabacteria bacterium]